MKSRMLIAALAVLPLAVQAHGNDMHKDTKMHQMHGSQGASSTDEHQGHAAALGRPGDPRKATRVVEVTMSDDMRFSPAKIDVRRGETIRFVVHNTGQTKHEMVLGTLAELKAHAEMMRKHPEMEHDDPNAVSVDPGKTGEFTWQFTKTGSFDFACLIPGHFEAGMAGKIAVNQ